MVSRDFGVKAMRRLRAPFCFIVLGFALLGVLPTLAGIAYLREDVALSPQGGQAAPVDPAPPAAASHPPARLLPPPPALQAASAVLLDLETGRLLLYPKSARAAPPGRLGGNPRPRWRSCIEEDWTKTSASEEVRSPHPGTASGLRRGRSLPCGIWSRP